MVTQTTKPSTALRFVTFVIGALLLPAAAGASTVDLGVFSFDNLIPDSGTPGVNVFDIANLTGGAWSLPPDFPVVTDLTLQSATLTLDGSGGPMQISLGDIAPGLFTPPASVQFADTTTFTGATLTASLSDPVLDLFDGSTFTSASVTVTATILPTLGDTLQAGTAFVVITASDESATPEPATAALLGVAMLALALCAKLFRQGRADPLVCAGPPGPALPPRPVCHSSKPE